MRKANATLTWGCSQFFWLCASCLRHTEIFRGFLSAAFCFSHSQRLKMTRSAFPGFEHHCTISEAPELKFHAWKSSLGHRRINLFRQNHENFSKEQHWSATLPDAEAGGSFSSTGHLQLKRTAKVGQSSQSVQGRENISWWTQSTCFPRA